MLGTEPRSNLPQAFQAPPPRIAFKGCQRCRGDVSLDTREEPYCVQCGHRPAAPRSTRYDPGPLRYFEARPSGSTRTRHGRRPIVHLKRVRSTVYICGNIASPNGVEVPTLNGQHRCELCWSHKDRPLYRVRGAGRVHGAGE